MLHNNLSQWLQEQEFEQLKINSSLRPEQLSISDYVNLANFVTRKN
jgi:16S rRNA (adenine1518-N6/adenine1519-N6)-dimethyltransferase